MPSAYDVDYTEDGMFLVTVGGKTEMFPFAWTNRKRLHSQVRYRLASKDAYWGEQELHNRLDALIWNHLPRWVRY